MASTKSLPAGRTDLPDEQAEVTRKAIRIEWLSIAYTSCTVTIVYFVLGNSQAMRTAWIEDILSVPQIEEAVAGIVELDWKVQDVVIAPVSELPFEVVGGD